MPEAIFEWHGSEYEHSEKGADWYWAVGVVATALIIAAILFGNYLFAFLVITAAAAIALHAAKHPPTHHFRLTDKGLVIDNDLHPFERMRSFTVFEYIDGNHPPMLSIKTDGWFHPHLVIPLHNVDADGVYAYLLTTVHEEDHEHTLSDLVAAWLKL